MKKFLSLLLAAIMMLGISVPAYAAESVQGLEEAYQNIIAYADENNIDLAMTYEDFLSSYNGESAAEYEQMFYPVFSVGNPNARSSSSSGSSKYYYNTGTTCPSSATYSKYNLLNVVKKGDIIFEANGGFGITGHVAIVEGIYSRGDGTNYIRLIEAIDVGVVRSILDDTRVDDKAVTILRVSSATTTNISTAVSFCMDELGADYSLDFAKDTSSAETDWYCSELVWAGYKKAGIDIEVAGLGEPGITPRDIRDSSKTATVSFSTN